MKVLKIVVFVIFFVTVIPSLVARDITPVWVKALAMGSIIVGGIVTIREQFATRPRSAVQRKAMRGEPVSEED